MSTILSSNLDPSVSSSRGRCVVLVPVGSAVEPDCERGLRELERIGYPVRRAYGFSAIDFGRSALASRALAEGFEKIMWVDADVGFHPADVDRLRRHNLPFCCGLYPKKNQRSLACQFLPGTERVVFGAGGGLTEVLYCGFGFVHTRRAVYDRVRERFGLPDCNRRFGPAVVPYFLPEVVPDPGGWWYLAEDYAFCERVRRCGFAVTADTTVLLSHVGRYSHTWNDLGGPRPRYATMDVRIGRPPDSPPGRPPTASDPVAVNLEPDRPDLPDTPSTS